MADLPAEVDAAVDAEIAELESRMANTHAWGHDKAGQERIQQLYEQQDRGTTPPPAAPPAAQRMKVIEEAMKDAKGEYWQNQKLQDEYRSLIEAEDAGKTGAPPTSLVGREDLADMPADVIGNEIMEQQGVTDSEVTGLAEWVGLDPASVGEGFANSRAFWDGMAEVAGKDGKAAIYDSYLAEVPLEAMRGIDREFCLDAPSYTVAGADEVTRFNQTSAGALASQLWGDRAPDYLGLMMSRWDRMTENLTDADFKSLDGFIRNRLSPRERAWVWTALAT